MHTEGEWEKKGRGIEVHGAGTIAIIPSVENGGVFEQVANAHLIAAAPDMYEACQFALDVLLIDGDKDNAKYWLKKALAKAKGGN